MARHVEDILTHCAPLLSRYKALICDVWGVLHDGVTAYPHTNEALSAYRAAGGHVVLLTNSPQMSFQIEKLLIRKNVARTVYDSIVTSGDLAVARLKTMNVTTAYAIGPPRHTPIYEKAGVAQASMDDAECVVCTGFFIEPYDDLEKYEPILTKARQRQLPMVCANPDLVVDVGGMLYPCAGALAARYEELGGAVHWAGKPHQSAYVEAFRHIEKSLGPVEKRDVLVIGDALRTDMAGAKLAGCDALFIAQGIHRHDVCRGEALDAAAVEDLFKSHDLAACAAAFTLRT